MEVRKVIGSPVRIENVNKFFGKFQVLKNINLEIKKGEFFSLLGPSGCGKTTLLRLIAGFEPPSSGGIFLSDNNVTNLPPNERPVNTVFQNYALFPHLSVFENVAFPLRLEKTKNQEVVENVKYYLNLVKLNDHAQKFPSQLSGGQKQRVAIARALINQPNVLLLDEPLSALDAKLRQQLLVELDTIHDEVGITFIYVTHDQQEALGVSDRIAIMNDGHVLQVGTSREIYEKPVNSFVANFIGETNLLTGTIILQTASHVCAQVEDIGEISLPLTPTLSSGKILKLSLRPESIKVSKTPPLKSENIHIIEGTIDEIIYGGFQSKLFIKTSNNFVIKSLHSHIGECNADNYLKWKDKVYAWWNIQDVYLAEVS